MNTALKLGGFAAGLAVAFTAAFAAGASADPVAGDTDRHGGGRADAPAHDADGHGARGEPSDRQATLPGLAVSQEGYTLEPAAGTLPVGRQVPFSSR